MMLQLLKNAGSIFFAQERCSSPLKGTHAGVELPGYTSGGVWLTPPAL